MAGEVFGTVVSYLKGLLMLIQSSGCLPTDTMGLLSDIMCSDECNDLSEFMKIVYVSPKRKTDTIEPITYLDLAESEYCTLYRGQKWTKSKTDPA